MEYLSLCYHYIRTPKQEERFPNILGISISEFEKQLKKLKVKFNFLSLNDLIDIYYLKKHIKIKKPGLLLTFDDGLSDHYEAAKILFEQNISAVFFVPSCILKDNLPANPNIIHYTIAKFGIKKFLDIYECALQKMDFTSKKYMIKYNKSSDDPWTTIKKIKIMFKYKFENDDSRKILLYIYKNLLEKKFPNILKNMHLTSSQLKKMVKMNHNIGTHTHSHISIKGSNLTKNEFQNEVIYPKYFYKKQFNIDADSFSYPFGEKNDVLSVKNLLKKTKEYKFAFTVEEKINTELTSTFDIGRYQPTSEDNTQRLIKTLDGILNGSHNN